jgi:hypothetical protein
MIQDQLILKAVSGIFQRSERILDLQISVDTFVDPGVLTQLQNQNNQMELVGLRG